MDGNQIFLTNVKGLLEERHENFVDLAKHVGVSASAISQWYSNLTFPRRKTQEKIALYLGTTVSALFDTARFSCNAVSLNDYADSSTKDVLHIKIDDDSMCPIFSIGDIATVKKQTSVQDGDFAVVYLNDKYVIREVQKSSKGILLLPQNNNYASEWLLFDDERLINGKVAIVGKVTELFKKFN